MKNYDDDKMNYDENGLYPDEKPVSESHPTASKVISALVLLCFIGGMGCMIYFGYSGNAFRAVYSFFGIWLSIAILGLLSDVLLEGNKPQSGLFVALGIGLIGILGTLAAQSGGEQTKMKLLKIGVVAVIGIFLVIGFLQVINKGKYILSSKDNCTESIMAECIKHSTATTSVNGRVTKVTYTPTYKFTFDEQEYTVTSLPTTSARQNGLKYEIFIDPANPTVFYDPEAEKQNIFSLILSIILWIGIPCLILIIFLTALKTAGI